MSLDIGFTRVAEGMFPGLRRLLAFLEVGHDTGTGKSAYGVCYWCMLVYVCLAISARGILGLATAFASFACL